MQLLTQSTNSVSALELRRQPGVNYRSAWLLKRKIMEAMRLAEDDRELGGRDEPRATASSFGCWNWAPFVLNT